MRVFITGLTGTLGTALANLHYTRGDQVWGCSRSEVRAVEWLKTHCEIATLFLTNAASLVDPQSDTRRLLPSMDKVYHCAAMKHVDLCETNPHEAFCENVDLTQVVSVACSQSDIPMTFISSDKACLPQGVYGATKLLAERIAIRENAAAVRLGNLIGSSGSVFALWEDAVEKGEPIRLTDPDMTRYFIGVGEAARFIADDTIQGSVVIPRPLKSVRMGDVAEAVAGGRTKILTVGRRPGETQHQWLIAPEEKYFDQRHRLLLSPEGDNADNLGLSSNDPITPRWDINDLLFLAGVTR